ncbi:unnamed protein product [Hyaloperonospora brassicae]|uniref:RxLR effector candidate protein n=1 Tax=Hyaloperonospora brassicae TaxID=162125 RepID=A0AAV0V003_HYABA|nr:unnamed protein product [Hyaloperonospora brassicae]
MVAGSDALLDHTTGIRANFTSANEGEPVRLNSAGKGALQSNDGANNAVTEERMMSVGRMSAEGLGHTVPGIEEFMAELVKVDDLQKKMSSTASTVEENWVKYAATRKDPKLVRTAEHWKEVLDEAFKMETVAWATHEKDLEKVKAAVRELEKGGTNRETEIRKETKARKVKRQKSPNDLEAVAWREKNANWEAESHMRKDFITLLQKQIEVLEKTQARSTNYLINLLKTKTHQVIQKYLAEFVNLKREGVTVEAYQKELQLDPSIVKEMESWAEGVTGADLFRYGPAYTKFFYYKVFVMGPPGAIYKLPMHPFPKSTSASKLRESIL